MRDTQEADLQVDCAKGRTVTVKEQSIYNNEGL
jgi:hypothetical protein